MSLDIVEGQLGSAIRHWERYAPVLPGCLCSEIYDWSIFIGLGEENVSEGGFFCNETI